MYPQAVWHTKTPLTPGWRGVRATFAKICPGRWGWQPGEKGRMFYSRTFWLTHPATFLVPRTLSKKHKVYFFRKDSTETNLSAFKTMGCQLQDSQTPPQLQGCLWLGVLPALQLPRKERGQTEVHTLLWLALKLFRKKILFLNLSGNLLQVI